MKFLWYSILIAFLIGILLVIMRQKAEDTNSAAGTGGTNENTNGTTTGEANVTPELLKPGLISFNYAYLPKSITKMYK